MGCQRPRWSPSRLPRGYRWILGSCGEASCLPGLVSLWIPRWVLGGGEVFQHLTTTAGVGWGRIPGGDLDMMNSIAPSKDFLRNAGD